VRAVVAEGRVETQMFSEDDSIKVA